MNTKIPVDKGIVNVLQEPIPAQLIKERDQGRTTLSYISGSTVIDYLNRAFGYLGWDWHVDQYWERESTPKPPSKWERENKGITEAVEQPPVVHCLGTLTVKVLDENGEEVKVSKQGFGSKSVIGGQTEQESLYKAAGTDALKKAASLFGIGAQLYRSQEEQEYFDEMTYEDPWTDEVLAMLKPEREFLSQVKKDNEWTDEDTDNFVAQWSDGAFQSFAELGPEDFKEFVAYVKEQMEAEESAS